jgi:hypothetical protein
MTKRNAKPTDVATTKPTAIAVDKPTVESLLHDQWFDANPNAPIVDMAVNPGGRSTGRYSGLAVGVYQNTTFDDCRADQLCDREIAANWGREFPRSSVVVAHGGAFPILHVNGARNSYNGGKHGNRTNKWVDPCPVFIDPLLNGGKRGIDTDAAAKRVKRIAKRVAAAAAATTTATAD